ncbi:MAG: hypothetical protein ABEJ03_05495 [Candidatus Nanohaloarchaea archaeon]
MNRLEEVADSEYGDAVTQSHSRLTTAAPEDLPWDNGRDVSPAVRLFVMDGEKGLFSSETPSVYEQMETYGINGLEEGMEEEVQGATLRSNALDI